MSPAVIERLKAEVARLGTKQAVADIIGRSRTAVSLALAGRYPAKSTASFEAAVLDAFDRIDCPFLGDPVRRDHCRATATGRCPTHSPHAAAHWRACQACPNKPQEERSRV
jgi:hypothetical protein